MDNLRAAVDTASLRAVAMDNLRAAVDTASLRAVAMDNRPAGASLRAAAGGSHRVEVMEHLHPEVMEDLRAATRRTVSRLGRPRGAPAASSGS